jgi:hypothetical protein
MIKKEEDEKEGTRHHSENPGRPTDSSPGETTTTRRGERQKEESQLVSSFLSI